jgi:hypothetical protein
MDGSGYGGSQWLGEGSCAKMLPAGTADETPCGRDAMRAAGAQFDRYQRADEDGNGQVWRATPAPASVNPAQPTLRVNAGSPDWGDGHPCAPHRARTAVTRDVVDLPPLSGCHMS